MLCEPGASVADLGSLYGAYTLEFARAGYQATGIEARPENIEAARRLGTGIPNLRYIQDDVRNIEDYGPFDAVFCCGLLYHLDEPARFLKLLGQVTHRVLIVQTHFAADWLATGENEGYPGLWYGEQGPENPWAAWGNQRSFWIRKPELFAAAQDAGFGLVMELHNHLADINGAENRVMFAAVKT